MQKEAGKGIEWDQHTTHMWKLRKAGLDDVEYAKLGRNAAGGQVCVKILNAKRTNDKGTGRCTWWSWMPGNGGLVSFSLL